MINGLVAVCFNANNASVTAAAPVRQVLDPEAFVHDRTGGRVLQVDFFARLNDRFCRECRQRRFVEATQDQLLFTGVGVDIADCEDAGNIGFKPLGVHVDRLAVDIQAPVGNRAELRRQAVKGEQLVSR